MNHRKSFRRRLLDAPSNFFGSIVGLSFGLLHMTVLRRRCPHCGRRGVRGVRCSPNAALTDDRRGFYFRECDCCHHQFWHFLGEAKDVVHIAPSDPRYIKAE